MHFPNVSVQSATKLNKTYIVNSQFIPPQYAPFLPMSVPDTKLAFANYMNMLTFDMQNSDVFTASLIETMERMYQNTFNKSVNASAVDIIPYVKNASVQCTEFIKKCWFGSSEFDCCSGSKYILGANGAGYQLQVRGLNPLDHLI